MGLNGFIFKKIDNYKNIKEKSWEPFISCLLNSTANQAHLQQNWAGWAEIFSTQILNGSNDFNFIYCFKYETIETHASAFVTLNILSIGTVPDYQESNIK
jgi:hypothetical protein